MWFSCFLILPGSAEAQVIWGGIVKRLLIAYFIGNISAEKISKSIHVRQSYGKPKVGRFFETRCIWTLPTVTHADHADQVFRNDGTQQNNKWRQNNRTWVTIEISTITRSLWVTQANRPSTAYLESIITSVERWNMSSGRHAVWDGEILQTQHDVIIVDDSGG